MDDAAQQLQQAVRDATAQGRRLRLHGGDTKAFYGNPVDAAPLDLRVHSGVVTYEPTELVITARGGTPLRQVEELLQQHGQRLTFEPPHFGDGATIGGAVASGLAGPLRPWGGAPRDVLLGVKLLDGQGRILDFGGQVMKNVAGYDVARLMAGAHGTLGILLEVSLKVLPAPLETQTLVLEMKREQAHRRMRELVRQPLPLSAAAHLDGRLYLRLSGSQSSVKAWQQRLGGERLAGNSTFWARLRDHRLEFFQREQTLWRLSLAGNHPRLDCEKEVLLDWAGAQRWVFSDQPAQQIHAQAHAAGGHAEAFRRGPGDAALNTQAPLDALTLKLHRELRARFDPKGLFNPGRLFDE